MLNKKVLFNGVLCMCVLVIIKKGSKIGDKELWNCIKNNPHGVGVGYYVNKQQVICKMGESSLNNMFNFAKKQLEEAYKKATSDIMFHARIATGSIHNEANCHPFKLNDECMLGHNGILKLLPSFKKISDTRLLCLLLKKGFLTKNELYDIVGYYNKVAFLYPQKTVILNEEQGIWENKIWYSNLSYLSYENMFSYKGYGKKKENTFFEENREFFA